MYMIGDACYLALLGLALAVGRRKHRWLVGLGIAGTTLLAITISAVTQLPFEFGLQARYIMPLSVAVLLTAGWTIDRFLLAANPRSPRRALRAVAILIVAGAAILQGGSWYVNERRHAVGDSGALWFASRSQWTAPGGWPLLIALAVAGLAMMAGASIVMARPALARTTTTDLAGEADHHA